MRQNLRSLSYTNPLKQRFNPVFFQGLPEHSGVYFMFDSSQRLLYIGKAKNLKHRISSYSNLAPGKSPEHLLEMIESISEIKWLKCRSEQEALRKENELLHAVRPPFNIASTEAEHYLFIGLRSSKKKKADSRVQMDFQLSSRSYIQNDGYEIHGCFKPRAKIKAGYTALIRLLYIAQASKRRFSYPAVMTRVSPPWLYSMNLPESWVESLSRFLGGRDISLLHLLIQQLLENDFIPKFMHSSIQEDIETVRQFYKLGPRATSELKRKHKIRNKILAHHEMDRLIAKEVEQFHLPQTA